MTRLNHKFFGTHPSDLLGWDLDDVLQGPSVVPIAPCQVPAALDIRLPALEGTRRIEAAREIEEEMRRDEGRTYDPAEMLAKQKAFRDAVKRVKQRRKSLRADGWDIDQWRRDRRAA